MIPVDLVEFVDYGTDRPRENFPDRTTSQFDKSAIVYWSSYAGTPKIIMDSRFMKIKTNYNDFNEEDEDDSGIIFIARTDIPQNLVEKLKRMVDDLCENVMQWSFQMH